MAREGGKGETRVRSGMISYLLLLYFLGARAEVSRLRGTQAIMSGGGRLIMFNGRSTITTAPYPSEDIDARERRLLRPDGPEPVDPKTHIVDHSACHTACIAKLWEQISQASQYLVRADHAAYYSRRFQDG